MKGYKAMNADMKCRGFQYEIGKSYKTDEKINLCISGFHFCEKISQPFEYYGADNTRLFNIEACGEIEVGDDKCVCSEIRIISEITGREFSLARYGYGYSNGCVTSSGDGDCYGYSIGLGDGRGYGFGNNECYGHGNGYGICSGDGRGYGYGIGHGDGRGCGININKVGDLREGKR